MRSTDANPFPVKQSGEQLPHAAVRAKERYGIDLTFDDVRGLARRCSDGEGHLETKADGCRFHALILGARVLWVVYRPFRPGDRQPEGIILTIMPPEIARCRIYRDFEFKRQRQQRAGRWRR